MRKIKLALALFALSVSTSAQAMPTAVPDNWWDLMERRLTVMAHKSGFCRANPEVWICWTP